MKHVRFLVLCLCAVTVSAADGWPIHNGYIRMHFPGAQGPGQELVLRIEAQRLVSVYGHRLADHGTIGRVAVLSARWDGRGNGQVELQSGERVRQLEWKKDGNGFGGRWKFADDGKARGTWSGSAVSFSEMQQTEAFAPSVGWPHRLGPARHSVAEGGPAVHADKPASGRLVWASAPIPGARAGDGRPKNLDPYDVHVISGGHASPVAADGRVFLTWWTPSGPFDQRRSQAARAMGSVDEKAFGLQADDVIQAWDAASGAVLWKRVFPGRSFNYQGFNKNGAKPTATIQGERVYFMGGGGWIYCLNTVDGSLLWEQSVGMAQQRMAARLAIARSSGQLESYDDFTAQLQVHDQYVIANDHLGSGTANKSSQRASAGVVVFHAETGEKLWHASDCLGIATSPRIWVHNGEAYVLASTAGLLSCFHLKDGRKLWDYPIGRSNIYSTTVADDEIYVSVEVPNTVDEWNEENDQTIACLHLSLTGPSERWRLPVKSGTIGRTPPLIDGDYVYFAIKWERRDATFKTGRRALEKVNRRTGAVVWSWDPSQQEGSGVGAGPLWKMGDVLLTDTDQIHGNDNITSIRDMGDRYEAMPVTWKPPFASTYTIWVYPAVMDGRIFMRVRNQLLCYDLRQ